MAKAWGMAVIAVLLLGVSGCGGLRYSRVSPEAKDFHPRGVAVLPADVKAFPQAKSSIDRLLAEVLTDRKWFEVVGGEEVERRMATEETFRQAVTDYLSKLDKLSYSDPELSSRIGELTGTDAFLLPKVDYWNYTTEGDTKLAKVSLSLRMIEARTGKTLWTAAHFRASDYLIIKPDLPDVARDLIREMAGHMPR